MIRWGLTAIAVLLAAATLTACGPTSAALVGDSIVTRCDPQVRAAHPHDTWTTREFGGTGFYTTPGFFDGYTWNVDDVFVSIGVNDAVRWDKALAGVEYNDPVDPVDYYGHVAELLSRTTGNVWWTNIRLASIDQSQADDLGRARTINDVLTLAAAVTPRMHVVDFNRQGQVDWFDPSDGLHPTSPDGCAKWAAMIP